MVAALMVAALMVAPPKAPGPELSENDLKRHMVGTTLERKRFPSRPLGTPSWRNNKICSDAQSSTSTAEYFAYYYGSELCC